MKIKKNDTVQVINGKDKGVTGKVISVDDAKQQVTVEGVNVVFRHVKPSQKNPQGGRLEVSLPVPASKVMALCPKTNKPTRVGYRTLENGTKERYAKKSGASMGEVWVARS